MSGALYVPVIGSQYDIRYIKPCPLRFRRSMQQSSFSPRIDEALLGKFDEKILSRTPHIVGGENDRVVTNPTPLVDLTAVLSECASAEDGDKIDRARVMVAG